MKKYLPTDITALVDIAQTKCEYEKCQALSMLSALMGCVPMWDDNTCLEIDNWVDTIETIEGDMIGIDVGSVFRLVARKMDKYADNVRDECATTEVYR